MLLAVILGTTAYGWDSIRVASPISKTDRFALHTQPPTGWATAPSTAFNLIQMAPSGLPPGRTQPVEKRAGCHAVQQEWIAMRWGSVGDGRRRPFFLVALALRTHASWAHGTGRLVRRSRQR